MSVSTARQDLAGIIGNLFRGALIAGLLSLCWTDLSVAPIRDRLNALPDYDFAGQAQSLLLENRFDEALLLIDAGMVEAHPQARFRLQQIRAQAVERRNSFGRRAREAARGALTGEGDSTEALAGAVIADLFVFGDLRDLIIQGGKALSGEDADEVIVALSAAGILLTATPSMGVGVAMLKFARRAGVLSTRFARALTRMARRAVRERDASQLRGVISDTSGLVEGAGAKPALRILRSVDHPLDLSRAADFARRPDAAYALYQGGNGAMEWLRVSGKQGERWLIRAGRKGPRGLAMLGHSSRALLRAHPLVGLLKGIYKGNVPRLLVDFIETWATAFYGVLLAWASVEAGLLLVRSRRLYDATRTAA